MVDAQRPGLSLELLDAMEEAIALIVERPAAWQRDSVIAGREIRRFVMRRFPFSIVYYVVDESRSRTPSGGRATGACACATYPDRRAAATRTP